MSERQSLDSIEDFIELLNTLTPRKSHTNISPHKYVFLLAVCKMLNKAPQRHNMFPFDQELITTFAEVWKTIIPNVQPGLPEYPYYHLASSLIWNHVIRPGKEEQYKTCTRFTPKRIVETIEYAQLDQRFFELLQDQQQRKQFIESVEQKIRQISGVNSHKPGASVSPSQEKESLKQYPETGTEPGRSQEDAEHYQERTTSVQIQFPHEQQAIQKIMAALGQWIEFLPNYYLYDPGTNQYLECDLIAIASDRIDIIELKHWSGQIDVRAYNWLVNGRSRPDPHKANKYKCQVLKGVYQKSFPYLPPVWVESIVVLTNPDAEVLHAHSYKADQHNLTFFGLETVIKHYKSRFTVAHVTLHQDQVKKVAARLRAQTEAPAQKAFTIPGFDVLENLTQQPHRIELLARQTGNELQRVKRLRVFIFDPAASAQERQAQRKKSLNSLKALEQIGDHPNVLKVWQIPHEDGHVIEASDWPDEGP